MDDQEKLITRREILVASSGIGLAGTLPVLTAGSLLSSNVTAATSSQSLDRETEWKQVAAIFETRGTIEPGDVLLIELPRSDIQAHIFGVPIRPDLAIDTEITFQHLEHKAIVKYELVLLDSEVNLVLNELFSQDLQPATSTLNAIHYHFLEMRPHIKYLHGTSIGDPVDIAHALRKALSHTGTPFGNSSIQADHPGFNVKLVEQIIGGTGMIADGILSVSVERVEKIRELGVTLQPAMQVESMANFQAIGNGRAAVAGEIIVLPQEANAVARSLRSSGLFVTALHHHELFIEPNFYYLHMFATGEPVELAEAIRKALNYTHSKFQ